MFNKIINKLYNKYNSKEDILSSNNDDTIKDICVDEYSKILMIKNLDNISITLKDLFKITQEAKKELHYTLLDNADKYNIEKYQDLILYIAREYRNLDKILPKQD